MSRMPDGLVTIMLDCLQRQMTDNVHLAASGGRLLRVNFPHGGMVSTALSIQGWGPLKVLGLQPNRKPSAEQVAEALSWAVRACDLCFGRRAKKEQFGWRQQIQRPVDCATHVVGTSVSAQLRDVNGVVINFGPIDVAEFVR